MKLNLLLKSDFAKSVLTLITGTSLAQAIPIVTSPIITRLYTPEDFGLYSLFLTIVGFVSIAMPLGYDQAIILQRYKKNAFTIFVLALISSVLISIAFFILTLVFKPIIDTHFNILGNWVYVIPLCSFLVAFLNLLISYNNRIRRYSDLAKSTVFKSITQALVQITAGFFIGGNVGLILGFISAQLVAAFKLLFNLKDDSLLLPSKLKLSLFTLSKKYSEFPRYKLPHTVLSSVSFSLPIYFLSYFFSPEVTGAYSLCVIVSLTPILIISNAIANVFNYKASELYNENKNIREFTCNTLKILLKTIALPYLLLVVFSPMLIEILFGSEWKEAAIYMQILSVPHFLILIVTVIAYLPNLFKKQSTSLRIEIVGTILKCVALTTGTIIFEDVHITLSLYAISCSLVLMYNFLWILKLLKKAYY